MYSLLENSYRITRVMTMSPLHPCSKPCSTGTHNETVKNLTLYCLLDRLNQDRTTALALFSGHSLERKCDNKHVARISNKKILV